jgi:hypothetical protein
LKCFRRGDNSLRQTDGYEEIQVEIMPVKLDAKTAKEMAGLVEQNILRMDGSGYKEEIFKAATKSQNYRSVRSKTT